MTSPSDHNPLDTFVIHGRVFVEGTNAPLPGLRVEAFDHDILPDDPLGHTMTDTDGRFEIRYSLAHFIDIFDLRPDVYLKVRSPEGKLLLDDHRHEHKNAERDEVFEVAIPQHVVGGG